MKVLVELLEGPPIHKKPIEFVERKGEGHPDTICDKAAEELSVSLSKYYLEKYGRILHHNVDKCILAGGQARAVFGGGEVIEPMYLLLVGRATSRVLGKDSIEDLAIGSIAVSSIKNWLRREFRFLDVDKHIIVDYRIKPGSVDLIDVFESGRDVPLANDTSFGVAFAPYTETERLVLETERMLNSSSFKREFPEVGEDVKVMGVRRNNEVHLIMAAAMVSSLIPNKHHYVSVVEEVRERVLDLASRVTSNEVTVDVNVADDYKANRFYLTVTGLSAENGDDGQVGRGNRVSGLITPLRPMSLEAAAGKNPISHVGKIYNVVAQEIVDTLVSEEKRIEEAYCYMLSQIGNPIDKPKVVYVEVRSPELSKDHVRRLVEPIVKDALGKLPRIWEDFLRRKYKLF